MGVVSTKSTLPRLCLSIHLYPQVEHVEMAPRKRGTNVPQSLPETDGADHPAESTATERESYQRAVTDATSSTAVDNPTAPRTRKAAQVEGVNPGTLEHGFLPLCAGASTSIEYSLH